MRYCATAMHDGESFMYSRALGMYLRQSGLIVDVQDEDESGDALVTIILYKLPTRSSTMTIPLWERSRSFYF